MDYITCDMNDTPIGIGSVVKTDKTVSVPARVGSVIEVVFRENATMLKIAGIRGLVENTHVMVVDFTELERFLFNAMSEHKTYLSEEDTHEFARRMIAAMGDDVDVDSD